MRYVFMKSYLYPWRPSIMFGREEVVWLLSVFTGDCSTSLQIHIPRFLFIPLFIGKVSFTFTFLFRKTVLYGCYRHRGPESSKCRPKQPNTLFYLVFECFDFIHLVNYWIIYFVLFYFPTFFFFRSKAFFTPLRIQFWWRYVKFFIGLVIDDF